MSRPPCEVADVFRTYWDSYVQNHKVTSYQQRVVRAIVNCRTSALGGHVYACTECGKIEQSYNSCRNRHCPKCQGSETAKWVDARTEDLLPVPYFHTIFTLPDHFNELVLQNKKRLYEILMQATKETILEVGKRNLKCKLGFFSVLHTWGQLMQLHPHVHCVIPGCGIKPDGTVKVFSQKYLLPVKVLSAVFRGKFIELLKRQYHDKKLVFTGDLEHLQNPDEFEKYLTQSVQTSWVVYCQPPFPGPTTIVKYLARYTYRIAISNSRLIEIKDGRVFFRYRDYKDDSKEKVTSLAVDDFMQRFLLHVVPRGFVRVRHYGFLSHSQKRSALPEIRNKLKCGTISKPESGPSKPHREPTCPCCGACSWTKIAELPRGISILDHAPPTPSYVPIYSQVQFH